MNKDEIRIKFINLRLGNTPLSEIASSLGISKSTAVRWNKQFADVLARLKSQKEIIVNEKISSKLDDYLSLFEKYFKIIEKELDLYKEFPMSFDVALDNSLKLFNTIQRLINMKKSFSAPVVRSDLNMEFLNMPDFNDSKNDTKNDTGGVISK
jgi:hypothetical protein